MTDAPPAPRSGRRRRLSFAIAAFCLATLVALVLVEIALRVYDPLRLPLEDMRGFYRLDAAGRIETSPGWRGEQLVENRRVPVRMNALGLRGAEVGPRRPGEKRVLVLGDSFVWGQGVVDDATIPARLEQSMRTAGADVTVGNAGMFGTCPREWGYTLDRLRAPFAPDLVFAVMYVGNDVLDALQDPLSVVDGWLIPGAAAAAARTSWRFRLMVTSRLWFRIERELQNSLESMAFAAQRPIGPPGLALTEALFLDRDPAHDAELPFLGEVEVKLAACFRDFARSAAGLPAFVVLLPAHEVALRDYGELLVQCKLDPALHERGRGHARLVRLLAAQGLAAIDLAPRILAEPRRKAMFLTEDWHFSAEGCAQVAAWLRPEVERRLP